MLKKSQNCNTQMHICKKKKTIASLSSQDSDFISEFFFLAIASLYHSILRKEYKRDINAYLQEKKLSELQVIISRF